MIPGSEILTSNATLIGVFTLLITLSISLSKVIEILIKKLIPQKKTLSEDEFNKLKDIYKLLESLIKKTEENTKNIEKQQEWVKTLYQQHSKLDPDGIPLWYMPRSFIETQKEIVSILTSISSQMNKFIYILDNLLKGLDNLERSLRYFKEKNSN